MMREEKITKEQVILELSMIFKMVEDQQTLGFKISHIYFQRMAQLLDFAYELYGLDCEKWNVKLKKLMERHGL